MTVPRRADPEQLSGLDGYFKSARDRVGDDALAQAFCEAMTDMGAHNDELRSQLGSYAWQSKAFAKQLHFLYRSIPEFFDKQNNVSVVTFDNIHDTQNIGVAGQPKLTHLLRTFYLQPVGKNQTGLCWKYPTPKVGRNSVQISCENDLSDILDLMSDAKNIDITKDFDPVRKLYLHGLRIDHKGDHMNQRMHTVLDYAVDVGIPTTLRTTVPKERVAQNIPDINTYAKHSLITIDYVSQIPIWQVQGRPATE